MGLTISFDLSLPAATPESEVYRLLAKLRDEAVALPFQGTSDLVRLTEQDIERPSPMHGLAFERLEDVVDVAGRFVRDELYRKSRGLDVEHTADDEYFVVEAPEGLPVVVIGFAVAPGAGSEPASFALAKLCEQDTTSPWSWQCSCKTQYASAHGDDHFLKCHTSVVKLLDAAKRIGIGVDVYDEAGFYESRDESELLASVDKMNRLVAQFAGKFSDAFAEAGGDSRQVQGEIFQHPDFERLETREE
jgi:hypothetical protein